MILRLSNLKNLEFVRHYVRELASDEPLCRPFLPMQCTVGDNCLNFLLLRPKHIGSFAQNSFQIDLSIENICNFGSRLLEMPLFYKMPLGGIQQLRGHNFAIFLTPPPPAWTVFIPWVWTKTGIAHKSDQYDLQLLILFIDFHWFKDEDW